MFKYRTKLLKMKCRLTGLLLTGIAYNYKIRTFDFDPRLSRQCRVHGESHLQREQI